MLFKGFLLSVFLLGGVCVKASHHHKDTHSHASSHHHHHEEDEAIKRRARAVATEEQRLSSGRTSEWTREMMETQREQSFAASAGMVQQQQAIGVMALNARAQVLHEREKALHHRKQDLEKSEAHVASDRKKIRDDKDEVVKIGLSIKRKQEQAAADRAEVDRFRKLAEDERRETSRLLRQLVEREVINPIAAASGASLRPVAESVNEDPAVQEAVEHYTVTIKDGPKGPIVPGQARHRSSEQLAVYFDLLEAQRKYMNRRMAVGLSTEGMMVVGPKSSVTLDPVSLLKEMKTTIGNIQFMMEEEERIISKFQDHADLKQIYQQLEAFEKSGESLESPEGLRLQLRRLYAELSVAKSMRLHGEGDGGDDDRSKAKAIPEEIDKIEKRLGIVS